MVHPNELADADSLNGGASDETIASSQPLGSLGGGSHPRNSGGASGVLREAIQKVVEEIEQHEREAKKHAQQARDLRSELRESFSYLLEQGEKRKSATSPEVESSLPRVAQEVKQPPASKRARGEQKPKPVQKRAKKK